MAGGINTYGYVGGNPVGAVDPTGLFALPLALPIGQAIVNAGTILLSGAMVADSISDKVEKARERKEYSRICKTPIQTTGDACKDAKANLNRLQQCLQLREDFGRKWYNDLEPGHAQKNEEIQKGIDNLDKWIKENCKDQCD